MTDFGERDDAVGPCRGVIEGVAPRVRIFDITHEVTPFDISQGARHLRKQRSRHSDSRSKDIERSRLVAVELAAAAPVVRCADLSPTLIVLLPNNRQVVVRRGFDQDTLAQLLTVLEKL